MQVADAQSILSKLRDICQAAGSKAAAQDLEALISAFDVHSQQDLTEFLERIELHLKPSTRYLAHLEAVGVDEDAFFEVLSSLKSDKSIKNKQLDEIGSAYLNMPEFSSLYRKRADKLRQIEMRFRQKQSVEIRGRVIRSTNPWQ